MLNNFCILLILFPVFYSSAQDKAEVNLEFNLSPAVDLSIENRIEFIFNSSVGIGIKKIMYLDSSSKNLLLPSIKYSSFENLYIINSNNLNQSNFGGNTNIIASKNISIGLDIYHRVSFLKKVDLIGGIGAITYFQSANSSSSQLTTNSDTAIFSVTNQLIKKTQFNYFLKMGIQRLLNIRERRFNISMIGYYYLREIVLGKFNYIEGTFREEGEVSTKSFNLLLSLGYLF
ncbi:MAG: hypothetical protein CMO34_02170 [Verrucomicrobia bacterium]|nr:hypothetical protein [Verrucomicrobiota bacterium]